MSYGFKREAFDVVAGVDMDARCQYAYETNVQTRFLGTDVRELRGTQLKALYPAGSVRVLAGCAPCQPFSLYRNGKARRRDSWRLLDEFSRLVRTVRPEIITMENVPQVQRHAPFKDFVASLEKVGYWATWYVVDGPEYGIPQNRTRLVLFASLLGAIEMHPPTHRPDQHPTVRDAIGGLEPIPAGGISERDSLHRARNLSATNQLRMAATPEGGWWRDWPEELKLACHLREGGSSYRNVYGRMSWDRPAPTLTTQCIGIGNGQFGHPEQDRAISLREAALLQTFPKSYQFTSGSEISMQQVALHIGNAVPVRLGQMVARSIKTHLSMCGAVQS
jgi:DNA (cytosine-5)-methyltransferase 1